MISDNLENIKNKYFEGKTSLEEEKRLKENSDHPLHAGLKSLQKVSMDFSFDTFIDQTKEKENASAPVISIRNPHHWKKYISIAAALIGICIVTILLYYSAPSVDEKDSNMLATRLQQDTLPRKKVPAVPQTAPAFALNHNDQKKSINKQTKKSHEIIISQHKKTFRTSLNTETDKNDKDTSVYNPNFVVINGKPVYDEEEAIQVTKASLNLLVSNIEKSQKSVSVIKKLSINL